MYGTLENDTTDLWYKRIARFQANDPSRLPGPFLSCNGGYHHVPATFLPSTSLQSSQWNILPQSRFTDSFYMEENQGSTLYTNIDQQSSSTQTDEHYDGFDEYFYVDDSDGSAVPPVCFALPQSFHGYEMQPSPISHRMGSPEVATMENMMRVLFAQSPAMDATHTLTSQTAESLPPITPSQLQSQSLEQAEVLDRFRWLVHDRGYGDLEENKSEGDVQATRSPSINDDISVQGHGTSVSPRCVSLSFSRSDGKHLARKPLRSKMHKCTICERLFPRPSGLATHMRRHSGLRPFGCHVCNKTFSVQSNAKRHLRTHGIKTTPEPNHKPREYFVDFDTPLVSDVHESSQPTTLTWVPQSMTSCNDADLLRYIGRESGGEDDQKMSSVLLSSITSGWDSNHSPEEESWDKPVGWPYRHNHIDQ